MAEISDDELRVLSGAKKLLDQLIQNPKTRRDAEKLVKKLHPEAVTTEDVVEPYVSEIQELKKELKDFLKAQADDKLDSKFNGQIRQLRDQGYTDDGIDKVKKIMIDEQIPNALAAAAFWEKQNPPKAPEPSGLNPSDWGIGRKTEDADMNLLFNDEDQWAEKEAQRVFAEERAKNGRILT